MVRRLGILLAVSAVLACAATAFIYLATEPLIRKIHEVPGRSIQIPTDPGSIAEGKRLATIRGCFDGCHGPGIEGGEFLDIPWITRLVAPNLTQIAASHTDAELEKVIRHGVRKNGKSVWGMPSSMFYHLSDEDLGRIIAFLRSVPVSEGPETEVWIGPLWRLELARWRLGMQDDLYLPLAEEIGRDAPWIKGDIEPAERNRGRYLAVTVCSECHGMRLRGDVEGSTPNLAIVAAYSEVDFFRLMRTATPLGGRQLGLMGMVARKRFAHLTDDEIRALYSYLHAMGDDT
jgi:cytochrome c553